jgi:glycosyltransferase involved in cell wall biosynthesis
MCDSLEHDHPANATPAAISRKLTVRPTRAATAATVSVVIPCYNYGQYLPEAVGSALSQEGAEVEVIVVDDRSTDNSLDVARALARADGRVKVVAHETNAGPVRTFNDGLDAASGEFLVRLDADDLLTPGALIRALAVMQRFPSVGLVYGHAVHFLGGKHPGHRDAVTSWTVWPGRAWLEARCASGFNVITSPEVLMRRSCVNQVGGQMPLPHTHDMEMWLRMAAFFDVAYIRGADQAWHREHNQSLSAGLSSLSDMLQRKEAFDVLFQGKAAQLPEAITFHAKAKAALAANALELAIRQYDSGTPDTGQIDILCTLARSLVERVETVPGWYGLERRMAMGGRRARRHPSFLAMRIMRGLNKRYSHWKWHRTGEW